MPPQTPKIPKHVSTRITKPNGRRKSAYKHMSAYFVILPYVPGFLHRVRLRDF